jgi:hypothetical protein
MLSNARFSYDDNVPVPATRSTPFLPRSTLVAKNGARVAVLST